MPPWDKYAAPAASPAGTGPWSKYGTQQPKIDAPAEPKGFVDKAAAALGKVNDSLSIFGDQYMQGIPGANTLADAAAAGIAAPFSDRDFGEIYKDIHGKTNARLQKQFEEHPVASIGLSLMAPARLGKAISGTKAGQVLDNSLRTGGTVSRAAKGAATGTAVGSAYGFGNSAADTMAGRVEDAKTGAAYGAAFGGAAPVVADAVGGLVGIGKGIKARGADALDNSLDAIKDDSRDFYNQARDAGVVLNRNRGVSIANKIQKAVGDKIGKLHPRLHGDTMAIMDELATAAKDTPLDLETLEQYRKLLGGVANKNFLSNKEDALAAIHAKDTLDDLVDSLSTIDIVGGKADAIDFLKQGRALWAKSRKFETVSDIIKKSDGDANYLRREIKKLLDNPKKSRGFSDEEREALARASKLTGPQGLMKTLGKFGFDTGQSRIGAGVGAITGSGVAGAMLGPAGAVAAPVIGTAARYADKYLARNRAEDVLRLIEGVKSEPSKLGEALKQLPFVPASGHSSEMRPKEPVMISPRASAAPWSKYAQTETKRFESGGSQDLNMGAILPAIKQAESAGNVNARNPNSSASGPYQFVDGTWKNMVMKYGKQYGIDIADKNNPEAQEIMAGLLTRDNANSLRDTLKREPSSADLYLAHVFGPEGAKRVLKNVGKGTPATNLFSREVVRANRGLFFKDNRPKTVEELYQTISRKVT